MHLDVTDFTQAKADDARALFAKHGVGPSALGYYSVPLSADREQAEGAIAHLPKVIDAAAMLGLSTINSFVGANHTLSVEQNLELFAQVWPPLVAYAEERGVRIAVYDHDPEHDFLRFETTFPLAARPSTAERRVGALKVAPSG